MNGFAYFPKQLLTVNQLFVALRAAEK